MLVCEYVCVHSSSELIGGTVTELIGEPMAAAIWRASLILTLFLHYKSIRL